MCARDGLGGHTKTFSSNSPITVTIFFGFRCESRGYCRSNTYRTSVVNEIERASTELGSFGRPQTGSVGATLAMLLANAVAATSLHVYDKVFHAPVSTLHDSARRAARQLFNGPGSRALPLEALHAVLTEVEDESPCVEYWWRDEWGRLRRTPTSTSTSPPAKLRCQRNGHALPAGRPAGAGPQAGVSCGTRGPCTHTCCISLARRCVAQHCVVSIDADVFGELTTVPAVADRLLRFDGDQTHAVRDTTWLTPFIVSQPPTPPEDCPLGRPLQRVAGATTNANNNSRASGKQCRRRLRAAPLRATASVDSGAEASGGAETCRRVFLLGDEARRGQPERARVVSSHEAIGAAEPHRVTVLRELGIVASGVW